MQFITSTLRVFLSMLYRDMQYLQKKKTNKKKTEKKIIILKINVPKVTMLCKWPLIYVCEYWLLLFFLSTGALAARVRGSSQRLATTGIYLGLFSLLSMKGTNSWQWYTATHETKSERLQILLIPPHPQLCLPNSIYLNIVWHWEAGRERGRSALKATLEEARGGQKRRCSNKLSLDRGARSADVWG